MVNSLTNQRKEIAEKLREIKDDQIFDRLADLIDPTCDFEECYYNDEFALRLVSGYICHNCGHEAIVKRRIGGWVEPPHYCPHCGARIVEKL